MSLFSPPQYERDYKDLSKDQKRAKALADVIEWLGIDEFVRICNTARQSSSERYDERGWSMTCFILGFSGYPVEALADHIWGFEPEEKKES